MWAWIGLVGVGVVGFVIYSRMKASSAAAATVPAATTGTGTSTGMGGFGWGGQGGTATGTDGTSPAPTTTTTPPQATAVPPVVNPGGVNVPVPAIATPAPNSLNSSLGVGLSSGEGIAYNAPLPPGMTPAQAATKVPGQGPNGPTYSALYETDIFNLGYTPAQAAEAILNANNEP